MRGLPISAVCLQAALACLSCSHALPKPEEPPSSEDPVWFRDETAQVGLDFVHSAGAFGRYFMPPLLGSGAALLDFDNDGRFDLYFVQNGGPGSRANNRLFRQTEGGRFEDVSAGSG